MAEKEERILCIETDEKNVECGYGDFYNTMTRKEAINRMAKAFFKSWYGEGFEQEDTDLKRRYKESAEAALNALLEGK